MAQVDKGEVRLRTLGGLQLEGRPFRRTKPLLVLAYLCLEGKQARRRIATLFWPHAKDPLASLSTELSRLRKACGEVVEGDDAHVWATVPTDAGELLERLEHPTPQSALQRSVEAYKGPFLSGVGLSDWSAELEGWVYSTREFLAGRVCEAHVQLGEAAAKEGRFSAGAQCAKDGCAVLGSSELGGGLDPELMPRVYTLLRADEHPYAADVARAAHDFGLDLTLTPAEARTHLRPSAQPLPTRGTSFIGRHEEIAAAESLLGQGERLLSVVGLAGMGKTRLALQIANRMIQQGAFRDGVDLVKLESLTSPSELPYRFAATLGIEIKGELKGEPGSETPVEALAAAIGDRVRLLVLDNFEHLIDEVMLLPELLERCPNLTLLVTSRERLNLAEEFVLWLEGLPFEDARSDALTLFVERAKRHRQGFDPSERDLDAVARICRAVGGSPLATELAAALVNVLPCEQIAEHLGQDLISLSGNVRNLPERQASLLAAFESSWRLLSEDEQRALMGLAVFRGGFTREAAQRVAGVGLSRLVALGDKALLRPQPSGRYDRHPLLYEFTRQKLLAQPELEEEVRREHAVYFRTFLEGRRDAIRGKRSQIVLAELDAELANLQSVWAGWLNEGDSEALWTGIIMFQFFFEFTSRASEGAAFFKEAIVTLEGAASPDVRTLGELYRAVSWQLAQSGRRGEAIRCAEESLRLLEAGEPSLRARTLVDLGTLLGMDHYDRALGYLQESLELYERLGEVRHEATVVNNLANLSTAAGAGALAERYHLRSVALHETLGDERGVARSLNNLGFLLLDAQRLEEAQRHLERSLSLCDKLMFTSLTPYVLCNLSCAARLQDMPEQASRYVARGLEMTSEQQSVLPDLLVEQARVNAVLGNFGAAASEVREALTLSQQGELVSTTLLALLALAEIRLAQTRTAEATRLADAVWRHPATYAIDRRDAGSVLAAVGASPSERAAPQPGEFRQLVRSVQDELQQTRAASA